VFSAASKHMLRCINSGRVIIWLGQASSRMYFDAFADAGLPSTTHADTVSQSAY
jgi:hypothetical protein